MPVHRTAISVSQLADLLGVEPAQFVAVERRCDGWYVVSEDDDADHGNVSADSRQHAAQADEERNTLMACGYMKGGGKGSGKAPSKTSGGKK